MNETAMTITAIITVLLFAYVCYKAYKQNNIQGKSQH